MHTAEELPQAGTSGHPVESGADLDIMVDPAQDGLEKVKKVVAIVAGIRSRNSEGEVPASPP